MIGLFKFIIKHIQSGECCYCSEFNLAEIDVVDLLPKSSLRCLAFDEPVLNRSKCLVKVVLLEEYELNEGLRVGFFDKLLLTIFIIQIEEMVKDVNERHTIVEQYVFVLRTICR